MTREGIMATLEQQLPRIVPGLVAAYLFGSYARQEAMPGSEIDIGLLFHRPPPSTLAARPFLAAAELESVLG